MGTLNFCNAAPWLNEDNTQQKTITGICVEKLLEFGIVLNSQFPLGGIKEHKLGEVVRGMLEYEG